MIQRVQTLFLLGIVICMGLFLTFPLWEKVSQDGQLKLLMNAYYLRSFQFLPATGEWTEIVAKNVMYVGGCAAVSGLLALISIFQFKKRLLQIKIGVLIALFTMGCVASMAYIIYENTPQFDPGNRGTFFVYLFLPALALILNSLANRFIKKDEDLVKSVDRFR